MHTFPSELRGVGMLGISNTARLISRAASSGPSSSSYSIFFLRLTSAAESASEPSRGILADADGDVIL